VYDAFECQLLQAALDQQGRAVEVMQRAATSCTTAGHKAVEGLHSLATASEQAAASLTSWSKDKGEEAASAAAHAAKAARKAIQVSHRVGRSPSGKHIFA
jgi:hypothetical protein